MQPRTSIILPAYNAGRYVAEATKSVLQQTVTDIEVIAIDDGSTDATLAILNEIARTDARLRVVTRENRGLVATLNEGLGVAKGSLIARMDADDIACPQRLEWQIDHMSRFPDCVALGGQSNLIDASGRSLNSQTSLPTTHALIENRLLSGRAGFSHPTTIFRKSAALEIGGYRDFGYAEDVDFFLRMGERGQLANLDRVLLNYRLHRQSWCQSKGVESMTSETDQTVDPVKTNALDEILHQAYQRREMHRPERFDIRPRKRFQPAEWERHLASIALRGRRFRTAAVHAFHAIRHDPRHQQSWRLLAKSFLRRP